MSPGIESTAFRWVTEPEARELATEAYAIRLSNAVAAATTTAAIDKILAALAATRGGLGNQSATP